MPVLSKTNLKKNTPGHPFTNKNPCVCMENLFLIKNYFSVHNGAGKK